MMPLRSPKRALPLPGMSLAACETRCRCGSSRYNNGHDGQRQTYELGVAELLPHLIVEFVRRVAVADASYRLGSSQRRALDQNKMVTRTQRQHCLSTPCW